MLTGNTMYVLDRHRERMAQLRAEAGRERLAGTVRRARRKPRGRGAGRWPRLVGRLRRLACFGA
ncbi:MAG: hypothetical protein HKP61_00620 [Dactylosporangium sp.]|nr:hypothetical protein [Dactylosporangium sp.]NNJ59472.1 hypothetical protein [Dactylosporangium sp.]